VCVCVYVNFIVVCNAIVGARVYVCVCACAWHEGQTTPQQYMSEIHINISYIYIYMRDVCVIQEICV